MFSQEGEENTANWLLALASQLSEKLNIPLYENTPKTETPVNEADIETYQKFLLEVLKKIAENEDNPQVVYPLLAANTDKLDGTFAQLLRDWATKTLKDAEPHTAQSLAGVIGNFSNLIREFRLGDQADNIEIAITGYDIVSSVYTRPTSPKNWAMTKNNLGNAYLNRIRGNKADNIEIAIAAYTDALEVRTRTDFLVDWATTRNNLGAAYSERIRGDKADNIEIVIAAYTDALEVRTCTAFPQKRATTQNNLGVAYRKRIKGDKADNLEKAIAAFSDALEFYTRTDDFSQDWATTKNNLGNAYRERIRGDKADNLEKAIAAYTNALEFYTRTDDFSQDWAMTKNNLGAAYSERIRGNKADNLEKAIAAYTNALEVRTRTAFPEKWAETQNNLGLAYSNRIRGDKNENLEEAIKAINAYTNALEVYTQTDFPQHNAQILSSLGIAYQESQQLDLAYDTFKSAIGIFEDLRGEIISGEESKRKQAEEWNKIFIRMVQVCLVLGRETEAIEYIERSKTCNLVEEILNRDLKTIFPLAVVTQLEQLRDEIASGQNLLQTGKVKNTTFLWQHLQKLRQQRQQLQDTHLPIGYRFNFASLEKIVDNDTAIIEWYITFDKILAFVIQPGGKEIKIWESSSVERQALFDLANEYVGNYREQKQVWKNQLEQQLQKLASILHIEEILDKIPLQCEKLILIPHQFLHLFPLHALPIRNSYLMDLFPQGVGYTPSLQVLQQVQLRECNDFQSLFAIQTPTEDLYGRDLGAVSVIKKQFSNSDILKQDKAKESAIIPNNKNLTEANNLFFFCHGYFNVNIPLNSGLKLADKILTLGDIITHIKLENCRLVTLAACETGMIDGTNISDEYIGLPNGFLLAGSTNIVGSLWTVSAIATALLMVRFYEQLQHQNNIVLALQNSQRWLRDATIADFRKWLIKSNLDEDWQDELDDYFQVEERKKGKDTKIFVSPFYWSAFCAIGKGV
ncbi:CHAT domain-containing protein [Sphaerospermopsis aphanizomenoides BCCUSP55]|uniref:CHAT domain-containing protein n=1 Tax=Sphaerospermopsis aphanizomenoides TaxID=459663 RepID=UPI001905E9CE|nr:CHAT domain-containing protein [Sphaerospermopsis aphanizomenoides]MBK1990184.1 CHAT domain-containing protein [Sphaerospermopsis aphanizomenoides BCCUSP55]